MSNSWCFSDNKMMIIVDVDSAYRWTCDPHWLDPGIGGCYNLSMIWANSGNHCVNMSMPLMLSWLIIIIVIINNVPVSTSFCSPPKGKCGLILSHFHQLRNVIVTAVVHVAYNIQAGAENNNKNNNNLLLLYVDIMMLNMWCMDWNDELVIWWRCC